MFVKEKSNDFNSKKGFVDNIRTWDARGKLMPLER